LPERGVSPFILRGRFDKLIKDSLVNYAGDLSIELLQSREEGRDISGLEERVGQIQSLESNDHERQKAAQLLSDEIANIPIRSDYEFHEPSDLQNIKKSRTKSYTGILSKPCLSDEILYDKIYGAWLGRCAGCLLGQPVEKWYRDRITGLLKETGNFPVKYYISSDIPENIKKKYGVMDIDGGYQKNWINNIKYMPEDDDTNYTIIGLKILEKYGRDFTSDDVAETWLENLPILHLWTAERVAYRNIVNGILPPRSATFRNPFREWIGAQIRADFFGYVNPGNPEIAAEMAWRDASISHTKNGIYGEMFVAAMLSAAYSCNNIEDIITAGLSQIPESSRLYKEIRSMLQWKKEGITLENAINKIHDKYDEKNWHDWLHTISNAVIVVLSLTYGEKDFEKAIGIAVSTGFDTDCNGATVGSIMGMVLGSKALPEKWIKPLNDKLRSGVDGFGLVDISDMARRTLEIVKK
jgi:ADP-ribosylglycohydrolase